MSDRAGSPPRATRRRLLEHSLCVVFGLLFLASLVGQAVAGQKDHNAQQRADGYATVSLLEYVASPDYAVDVAENWQSEYLQFLLFIMATIWFAQRGSTESKPVEKLGTESDKDQKLGLYVEPDSPDWAKAGGWRTALYARSLGLVMGTIFLATWAGQSVAGWVAHNEERIGRLEQPLSWSAYLTSADFWSRSLQNWQSEFLAVGSMAAFSVFLRQRGSAQSKPVGEPHASTGASG